LTGDYFPFGSGCFYSSFCTGRLLESESELLSTFSFALLAVLTGTFLTAGFLAGEALPFGTMIPSSLELSSELLITG
jgi:hypothetical protein